jgi:Mg2+ and Co2+ transporter CorA
VAAAATTGSAGPAAASSEPVPEVKVDFATVLRKGGLSDEEQGRVERTLGLLSSLPADTPLEIKRQIVGASLQAFGISIEQIIESAALQIRALGAHSQDGQKQTQAFLEQGTRRIAELEKELSRIRSSMQEQQAQQRGLEQTCNQKKRRVQDVLDFFGTEAVEKATKLSAKLRNNPAT